MAEPIHLDIHAHLAPPCAGREVELEGVEWREGKLWVDGFVLNVPNLFHPEELIAWMTENAVAHALVSVPPPLYRTHLSRDAAARWADYVNRGLAEVCADYPDRLVHLPYLSIEHPEIALDVVRAYRTHRVFGFAIGAGASAPGSFSEKALFPLWEALDEGRYFVLLHPGACCDRRLKAFYLENLLGNPYETSVAAAHLVFAGIPRRFPNIHFCLAHGGGGTALLAGRWQRGFDTARPGVHPDLEPPRDALRRFHVDSIVHDAAALGLTADVFGSRHVLFGSDWPFPMGLPQPHVQLAGVDSALRARIFRGNPASLMAKVCGGRFAQTKGISS